LSFGLLFPAFLAAMAAIALPIWLHMRHSDKDKPFRFPSLMFLEKLPIRTASRRRLVDIPLLLLRIAAIALLVLAFGRPYYARDVAAEMAKRPRAVVILLDRSGSMGHTDVWPAALDSARALVKDVKPEDRFAVVLFDDEAEIAQSFTSDAGVIRAAINAAKPGERGTRYATALRAARQLLSAAPDATHEVYVVTDVQRTGVNGLAGLDLPTGMEIKAVPVAPKSRANTAIAGVDARRITGPRVNIAVQARVSTRELPGPRRVRASLALNGRPSGARDVTLPATGDYTVAFDAVPLPSGRVTGTVTLENDNLKFDDAFTFTLPDFPTKTNCACCSSCRMTWQATKRCISSARWKSAKRQRSVWNGVVRRRLTRGRSGTRHSSSSGTRVRSAPRSRRGSARAAVSRLPPDSVSPPARRVHR
jgi:Mg-chelatase subunit ChlD